MASVRGTENQPPARCARAPLVRGGGKARPAYFFSSFFASAEGVDEAGGVLPELEPAPVDGEALEPEAEPEAEPDAVPEPDGGVLGEDDDEDEDDGGVAEELFFAPSSRPHAARANAATAAINRTRVMTFSFVDWGVAILGRLK